jgi:hypothetical protein
MRSLALTLPALLAAAFVVPHAEAQLLPPTGQTTTTGAGTTGAGTSAQGSAFIGSWKPVKIVDPDSEDVEELKANANVFINRAQCNRLFVFEFQNVSPPAPVMELWVANNDTDCSNPAARTITAQNPKSQCWLVASKSNVRGTGQKFDRIPGRAIFNLGRTPATEDQEGFDASAAAKICEAQEANNTPYQLWFIPVASRTDPATGTAPPATATPFRIRFNLYTIDPPDPSGVKARGGESAITVDWNNAADPLITYRAFFNVNPDPAVCGTGAFASEEEGERLTGSEVVVDDKTVFASGRLNKPSAMLKGLGDKGIELGTQVAVAVASEDRAGNIGPLSEPQCVTVVDTISTIDACGGSIEECGLETCGLSPASRGSWFGLSLFVLGLAALIRRRTA